MQLPKSTIAVALIGVLAAACGGTAATQGPDGPGATSGNGGQATIDPGPGQTQSGNGNGNGNGGDFGSVRFTVSGPFDVSDEYAFAPAASILGTAQGSVLNFTDTEDASAVVSILVSPDGTVVVSYSGTEGQVPGAVCTTTDFKVEVRSASGKFDCTSANSFTAAGAVVGPGTIKGEFSARA